ncbi:MAG: zf-HC2 domain-containing protein [Acidobacteriota bacterium]
MELASACPDTELLAAYLENNLTVETREQVEAHLVECRICRRIVAEVIKSESVVPDPVLLRKPLR